MSEALVEELEAAARAVEDAGVPADLQAAAFGTAFWAARGSAPKAASRVGKVVSDDPGLSSRTATVAARLGVDEADVSLVFDLSEDDVALLVPPRLLADKLKTAGIEIVYLVAAARQALGEEWTSSRTIHSVAIERGKEDSNFSRTVADLDGHGLSVKTSGKVRLVRLNASGYERTAEIVERLAEALR